MALSAIVILLHELGDLLQNCHSLFLSLDKSDNTGKYARYWWIQEVSNTNTL